MNEQSAPLPFHGAQLPGLTGRQRQPRACLVSTYPAQCGELSAVPLHHLLFQKPLIPMEEPLAAAGVPGRSLLAVGVAAAHHLRGFPRLLHAAGPGRRAHQPSDDHFCSGRHHLSAGHLFAAVRDVSGGPGVHPQRPARRENQLLAVESRRYTELRTYIWSRRGISATTSASTSTSSPDSPRPGR